MNKKLNFLIGLYLCCLFGTMQAQTPNYQIISSATYPTDEVVVASFNVVTDFNAKGDGVTNDVLAFQRGLDRLSVLKGGVLYVPAGKYRIVGKILIPKGVTLRGDWKKPVKGQPVEGTILMADATAYAGKDIMDENYAFITMESNTLVSNIAIWYPGQDPNNIKKYAPSILMGKQGYFGNEYCNVRNVTLVNSYNGVCSSKLNGGACHNVYGLYGTPLSIGVEIDNISDVSRLEWIDFSPDYWAGSGLPGSPALNGAHKSYIYENATGVMMRRNDWTYACFMNIEGYNKGFSASPSRVQGLPNGHNYGATFKNCKNAVYADGVSGSGIMFTRFDVENCENGFVLADGTANLVHLNNWNINATSNAVLINENSATSVLMGQCTVTHGKVNAQGAILSANDCDFNNAAPQIILGESARANLTGNRFAQDVNIKNNSMFKSNIDHTPVETPALPAFPELKVPVTKPAKSDLFVVTDAPYNAVADGTTDNTAAIQQALDAAGANGGGLVFLPPGHYKVLGNLTVPTGVELRGACDISSIPAGPGSIIEVYAGKDDNTATPFLKLAQGSGMRGIDFNYPEQMADLLPNMHEYPYCIQVTGANVYLVNVGIRATMYGVDMFTYKCDNHYIEYLAGHVFKNGIRVGGGTENGLIYNTQFNNIGYACGMQTKFGVFPNSPADTQNNPLKDMAYLYGSENQHFMILGNCKNQLLYNDFHIGSQVGVTIGAEDGFPSGLSLGLALDDSRRSLRYVGIGAGGFDLINTQVVSIEDKTGVQDTKFVEADAAFTGKSTLFSANYWGGAKYAITAGGGELNFVMSNFKASGGTRFMQLSGNPTVKIINSFIAKKSIVNSGFASKVFIQSSLVDAVDVTPAQCALWKNNLGGTAEFIATNMLSRTGWIASSFNNNTPNNAIDGNASTRWTAGAQTTAGQWFAVNTRNPVRFNRVIIDTSPSANDGPAAYALYLSNDGTNWGEPVKTGAGASVTIIKIPQTETQYVKVAQTTTDVKTNYWSIHEFYLALAEEDDTNIAIEIADVQNESVIFSADGFLYVKGLPLEYPVRLNLYSISGQKVIAGAAVSYTSGVDISALQNGIYIAEIEQNGKVYREKVIKK